MGSSCGLGIAALLASSFAAAALAVAPARSAGAAPPPGSGTRTVCIRGVCFEAEVALTAEERARGLMWRRELAEERGMLFVFPGEARHRFWMKNTLIELDIIFIGADRRVAGIAHRAVPCLEDPCRRYGPARPVAYALEIAGGLAERHGFVAGDEVQFR